MQKSMIKLVTLADFFSILNAVFGFFAILFVSLDELDVSLRVRFAVSFILLAVLSDGIDGIVARKGKNGVLGDFLDPVADFLSFCVAPSMLFFSLYYSNSLDYIDVLLLVCTVVFIVFGLIRLSAFHSMKKQSFFVGLPAPASGLIVALLAFVHVPILWFLPVIILLPLAMISNLKFPKTDKKVGIVATVLILLTLILGGYYYNIVPNVLLFTLAIYVILGPFYVKKKLL